MSRLIKICAMVILLVAAAIAPAHGGGLSLKRGLNLDIWDTWPPEDRWNERATLLPFPEWRRKLGVRDFKKLKAAGFDFVRIPIDPAPFLSPRTEPFRDALYASVLQSVQLVTGTGLKAVVDLHTIPSDARSSGSKKIAEDAALFARYLDFVRAMARMLARENPKTLAMELMNEPLAGCDGNAAVWAKRSRQLFAAARSSAPRLTLVMSGGCWSGAESLAEIDPSTYPDDNLLWTFHSYAPFLLTHQGAGWAGDFIPYVTGLPYPPFGKNEAERDIALARIRDRIRTEAPVGRRAGLLSYLDELMAEVDTADELENVMAEPFGIAAGWADRHGIDRGKILLGEFGMIRQEYGTPQIMKSTWRAAYIADMTRLAERHGFSWSIWGYGGAFGIVEAFGGQKSETDVLDIVRNLP